MIAPTDSIVSAADDRAAVLAELLGDLAPASLPAVSTTAAPQADRDARGRFVPGHRLPGPGRPPGQGVDIRAAAERAAAERGIDLRIAVGEVVLRLIEQAKGGDVQAAALLLKSVGIADDAVKAGGIQIAVITGVPRANDQPAEVRVITGVRTEQGDEDA